MAKFSEDNRLVDNTLELECLLQSIEIWQKARNATAKCYAKRDVSPGYHCERYVEEQEKAAADFGNKLKAFVDARIMAALSRI